MPSSSVDQQPVKSDITHHTHINAVPSDDPPTVKVNNFNETDGGGGGPRSPPPEPTSTAPLLPHERHAINFLVNEYLLEQHFKMTSVTFSEENETQDLEDWDVVGLNRSKPPSLSQLYKSYFHKKLIYPQDAKGDSSGKTIEQETQTLAPTLADVSVQMSDDLRPAPVTTESQTEPPPQLKTIALGVNFDKEAFDQQRAQLNKLLERQELLVKSIARLESEIGALNVERDTHLKRIDTLQVALRDKSSTAKSSTPTSSPIAQSNNEEEKTVNENNNHNDNKGDDLSASIAVEQEADEHSVEEATKIINIGTNGGTHERQIPSVYKELIAQAMNTNLSEENQKLKADVCLPHFVDFCFI